MTNHKTATGLFLLLNSFAFAQGTSGGGGNDHLPYAAYDAWFTGNRSIRYCVEVADRFGISKATAEDEIAKAFQTWKKYMIEKRVNERFEPTYAISTHSTKMNACDTTEDLHFYLGSENREILTDKKKYWNPDAFSKKTSYEVKKGWGRGYIWVASERSVMRSHSNGERFPVWKDKAFRSIVMHELGHVFGNGHVPGTIMDETISQSDNSFQGKVDGLLELYGPLAGFGYRNSTGSYQGRMGSRDSFQENASRETFKLLTGRYPKGRPHTEFSFSGFTVSFKISDDLETITLRMKNQQNRLSDRAVSPRITQVFGVYADSVTSRLSSDFSSFSGSAIVYDAHKKPYRFTILYNMMNDGATTYQLKVNFTDHTGAEHSFLECRPDSDLQCAIGR